MDVDVIAYRALRDGREEAVRRLFLGPEIQNFESIAATSERLARYEGRRATATEQAFADARDDARKRLIAVALGARLVIMLLLVTAWDIARLGARGRRTAAARNRT